MPLLLLVGVVVLGVVEGAACEGRLVVTFAPPLQHAEADAAHLGRVRIRVRVRVRVRGGVRVRARVRVRVRVRPMQRTATTRAMTTVMSAPMAFFEIIIGSSTNATCNR